MKRTLFFFTFTIFVCLHSFGQTKDNAVKINGLSLLIGLPNVAYERALNDKSSVQAAIAFASFKFSDTKFGGFALTPEYRYYPAEEKEALDGFYIGPALNYSNFNLKVEGEEAKASLTLFGVGGKLGWHWLLGKSDSFSMDLGLGISYMSANLDVKAGNEDDFNTGTVSGVVPLLAYSIGYAF